ncbi:MAG: signal peptidase I [Pseudomonadota bacterium]|nr:signal peptidase I [Pseudomonadota bacterium]
MSQTLRALWAEHRSILFFVLLMVVFRSSWADWNDVPSGSMEPSILVGDRILVDRAAYDLRVPLFGQRLLTFADPVRGDVVVFESAAADKRLVKRVIGVPGDVVAMRGNALVLNGEPLAYRLVSRAGHSAVFEESLPGTPHAIRLSATPSLRASFDPVTVPAGHYLVLGDNRDSSADSRAFGFVPREEIIGRSDRVVLSLDYEAWFMPRFERFGETL